MPGIDKRSSAAISISATGKDELRDALALLRDVAARKSLIMITPVDVGV
jgi:ACT domain-containing protein